MDSGLTAWLKSQGQTFTPDLSESGVPKYFKRPDGKDGGWYLHRRAGEGFSFTFCEWSRDERVVYTSPGLEFNPDDPEYIAAQELAEAKREEKQLAVRGLVLGLKNSAGQNMMTPYLEKKGFTVPHPTLYQRIQPNGNIDLLVPLYDIDGELWSMQVIEPEGDKSFFEGGRVRGLMHCLTPEVSAPDWIYVCEGLATGLSVLELLPSHVKMLPTPPSGVYCALSSSNLKGVAVLLRERYPYATIYVCADNDHLKDRNAGLKAGVDAARACAGEILYPPFKHKLTTGTDWNDFVVLVGREEAKKEFQKQLDNPNSLQHLVETEYGKIIKPKKKRTKKAASTEPTENAQGDFRDEKPSESASHELPEILRAESGVSSGSIGAGAEPEPILGAKELEEIKWSQEQIAELEHKGKVQAYVETYMNGLKPMKLEINKKGIAALPSEQKAAHYVLRYYISHNIPLRRWGAKDLFCYTGTHWKVLDDGEMITIKNQIFPFQQVAFHRLQLIIDLILIQTLT